MELKNLVELLYTAHRRFTTIQVAWQYKYNSQLMHIAETRWVSMNPPGSVAMLTSPTHQATQVQLEVQKQLWWQKPNCWREEWKGHDSRNTITVLCDGDWWAFSIYP